MELACLAVLTLFAGLILASDFSYVDDVTYYEVAENDVISADSFVDSDSEWDEINNSVMIMRGGEENKAFTGDISLREGDALKVRLSFHNQAEEQALVNVELLNADEERIDSFSFTAAPGADSVSFFLSYGRNEHSGDGEIQIASDTPGYLEISNLEIQRETAHRDDNGLVRTAVLCMRILAALAGMYLAFYLLTTLVGEKKRLGLFRTSAAREWLMYAGICLVTGLFLAYQYRYANLSYPMVFDGGDEMGIYFLAKSIRDGGMALVTQMEGGISGADMFDYPYSDKLSFLFIKLISLFTKNPYTITWIFYFLCHFLIANISAAVCRKLGLSRPASAAVGILYAFSAYIQLRKPHMWLVPYYMIPVACYISVCIADGKVLDEQKRKGSRFWIFILLSYLCAFTGMYYAYFSCALFAVAIVIRLLNVSDGKYGKELAPCLFILSVVAGVVTNILPNVLYWRVNGSSPYSEFALRSAVDTEVYGLKLVQMLLPNLMHRIPFFSHAAAIYSRAFPLVNENVTASIGLLASIGFGLSMLLLLKRDSKYRTVAALNFAVLGIAMIGGVGTCISLVINIPMRCYNRMSIIIMFLSLLLVFKILDEYLKPRVKNAFYVALCILLVAVGLFDQTNDYAPSNYSAYESTRDLVDQIEESVEDGGMIFELPYDSWPSPGVIGSYKQHVGYIESENLVWSYGAMQGREEASWQEATAELDSADMVRHLFAAGYDGIYLDAGLYQAKYDEQRTVERIESLTQALGREPLISRTGEIYFWPINN